MRVSALALLLPLLAASPASAAIRCGTHDHFAGALSRIRPAHPALPASFAGKLTRDALGTFPNAVESSNFVLKWGSAATYSAPTTTLALDALEAAWNLEVTSMVQPQPPGAATYKINVYIGNSGAPAPTVPQFAYAYADIDADGDAIIVMSPEAMAALTDPQQSAGALTTIAHEFYHAVQFGTGNFTADTDYWYWEASAMWIQGQAYPDGGAESEFMGGYVMYPEVALDFYDYPDTGTLIEYHHYGAGIFLRYISEKVADYHVMRDAWVDASPSAHALEALDANLQAAGSSLPEAFAGMAAHNAVLDYQHGDVYAYYIDYFVSAYPTEDFRVAVALGATGGSGAAPAARNPAAWGYNLITMAPGKIGPLHASVRGAPNGSLGTSGVYRATLVRRTPAGVSYDALTGTDREIAATVDLDGTETQIVLAVVAAPVTRKANEVFPWDYALSLGGGGKGQACGCDLETTAGASMPALLAAISLGVIALRRRRT